MLPDFDFFWSDFLPARRWDTITEASSRPAREALPGLAKQTGLPAPTSPALGFPNLQEAPLVEGREPLRGTPMLRAKMAAAYSLRSEGPLGPPAQGQARLCDCRSHRRLR